MIVTLSPSGLGVTYWRFSICFSEVIKQHLDPMFLLEHSSSISALNLVISIIALHFNRTGEQQLLAIDLQQKKISLILFSHSAGFQTNFYFISKAELRILTFCFILSNNSWYKKSTTFPDDKDLTQGTYIRCLYSWLLILRDI